VTKADSFKWITRPQAKFNCRQNRRVFVALLFGILFSFESVMPGFKEEIGAGVSANPRENAEIRAVNLAGLGTLEADLQSNGRSNISSG